MPHRIATIACTRILFRRAAIANLSSWLWDRADNWGDVRVVDFLWYRGTVPLAYLLNCNNLQATSQVILLLCRRAATTIFSSLFCTLVLLPPILAYYHQQYCPFSVDLISSWSAIPPLLQLRVLLMSSAGQVSAYCRSCQTSYSLPIIMGMPSSFNPPQLLTHQSANALWTTK